MERKFFCLLLIILLFNGKSFGQESGNIEEDDYDIEDIQLEPMSFSGQELKKYTPVFDRETFLQDFSNQESEIPIVIRIKGYFDGNKTIMRGKMADFLVSLMEELNPEEETLSIVDYVNEKILIGNFSKESYNLIDVLDLLEFPRQTPKAPQEENFNIDL